jgi:predicted nucleic acid-binding protein
MPPPKPSSLQASLFSAKSANVPDPIPTIDGLLAATAIVHGLVLATRNTADISRTGVRYLNPFEGSSSAK